jgi:hypothetical protein
MTAKRKPKTMSSSDRPDVPRSADGRFLPGNPGRAFGSRNKISKRIARSILLNFEADQEAMLAKLKRWYVPQYVALLARLLPRVSEDAGSPELDGPQDDADTARVVSQARAMLDRIEAGEATRAELEAALLGEGRAP